MISLNTNISIIFTENKSSLIYSELYPSYQNINNNFKMNSPSQFNEAFFNYSNYYFYLNPETWEDAKLICENLGYHLVTISSYDENIFIEGITQGETSWIGFTDQLEEGNWVWVTGEPVTFTSWNEGQPDDWGEGEDYGLFEGSEFWNDVGLDQGIEPQAPYVCESSQDFENDDQAKGILDFSSYEVFYNPVSWEQAKTNCENLRTHLVTISSSKENNFVTSLAIYSSIWIGFTDENIEGLWVWITGEPILYTNWDGDEPNDEGGEDYAESNGGNWNDIGPPSDLDLKRIYICESTDSDQDTIPDLIEIEIGLDPNINDNNGDLDGDGLPNIWEYENGLDPTLDDSSLDLDSDGLTNLEEFELGSSPNNNDTDFDGMLDGWEVDMGLNILENDANGDKDGDFISNLLEYSEGTNADNFWDYPIFKSEFPFIYLSLPIILVPAFLIIFLGIGVGIGFFMKHSKKNKIINQTNAPDYDTAVLVMRGKFIDYEQYNNAKKFNVTNLNDYELALELKRRQDEEIVE